MTRRAFLSSAVLAANARPLVLPIDHIVHGKAAFRPGTLDHFNTRIWPEALRDLNACGISVQTERREGEIRRTPGGQPIFTAVRAEAVNMVITDHVPLHWDNGRALAGTAVRYPRYDVCVIALNEAHAHKLPFIAVNTCLHELLHVLLRDTVAAPESAWRREYAEFRVNVLATRLWLFRDGARIRHAAGAYLAASHHATALRFRPAALSKSD